MKPTDWERKLMAVMLQRLGGHIYVHKVELEGIDKSEAEVNVSTHYEGSLSINIAYGGTSRK